MKRRTLLAIFALAGVAMAQTGAQPDNLDWWRQARFGMFIHWGLYAVPAGEWKGKPIAGIGEWIMNRAKIPVKEYELLAREFNPVKFNAEEWVKIAEAAGQKYIVITSKHHDGFAMFKSKVSPYNIADATPFKRDPIQELAEACKRHNIRLCFYYSQAQDWHEPDGWGNTWDFDAAKKNYQKYLDGKAKPQVRELLTQYGPIGLIWYDTPMTMTKEQSMELRDLVHSIQPKCIVSGRVGNDVGDYRSTGDNQIPVSVLSYDWETPITLNDTWGFKKDDDNWKSTQTLIRQLVDVVSKNGNYLLNVGPTREGVIPKPSVDRLAEVGKWMKTNGEAVYSAKPSPFPYEFEWGSITSKPGKLYAHVIDWPKGEFVLYGLKTKVTGARLLEGRKALKFTQSDDKALGVNVLRVQVPAQAPHKDVSVIALDLAGPAEIQPGLRQQPDGKVTLSPVFADVTGNGLVVDLRGVTTRWLDPAQSLKWSFHLSKPGTYNVVLLTSEVRAPKGGDPWEGGHAVKVSVGGREVSGTVTDQGRIKNERNPLWKDVKTTLGTVKLDKTGRVDLTIQPSSIVKDRGLGLSLHAVELIPAS